MVPCTRSIGYNNDSFGLILSSLYFSTNRLYITVLNSIPLSVIKVLTADELTSGSNILSSLGTTSLVILLFIGTPKSAFQTGLNNVRTLMCSSLDFLSVSFIGRISSIHLSELNFDDTLISRVAFRG